MSDKEKQPKKFLKVLLNIILVISIILCVSIIALTIYKKQNSKEDQNVLSYTQLVNEINNGNVEKIEMTVGSTNLKVKINGGGGSFISEYN